MKVTFGNLIVPEAEKSGKQDRTITMQPSPSEVVYTLL